MIVATLQQIGDIPLNPLVAGYVVLLLASVWLIRFAIRERNRPRIDFSNPVFGFVVAGGTLLLVPMITMTMRHDDGHGNLMGLISLAAFVAFFWILNKKE